MMDVVENETMYGVIIAIESESPNKKTKIPRGLVLN
jgi:hypothetical protein